MAQAGEPIAAGLACPHDGQPLAAGSSDFRCGAGHRFPLRRWAGSAYGDFRDEESLDETAQAQRVTYEAGSNRYALEGAGAKAAFMRAFVSARLRDEVKSKEDLLLSTLRELPLGPQSRLLEIGSNDGRYLDVASAISGGSGLGIDLSERSVRQAIEARPPECRAAFHVGRADRLPVASGSVDCVLSFDVFEHLGHPAFERTMAECGRVLRPGGWLLVYIVSRKDRFTLHETLRQLTHGRIGVDESDGHRHENFIHPEEFRGAAGAAGLAVERLRAYHGFWTLFADYYLHDFMPRWGYRFLHWLDYPLVHFEHGNGFLGLARRKGTS